MKKLLLLLLFTCGCGSAFANPILVLNGSTYYSGTKNSESCIAVIGESTSSVSCDVYYELTKEPNTSLDSHYVYVALPVFILSSDSTTDEKLTDIFVPRLEFKGRIIAPNFGNKPMRIRNRPELQEFKAPAGTDVVLFGFTVKVGVNQQNAHFLVRYTQPMINGKFLYMPLFEGSKAPSGKGPYRLEALAFDPSWSLVATKTPNDRTFASRVSFDLSKQDLIELKLKKQPNQKTEMW